jgi:hypothetical protein
MDIRGHPEGNVFALRIAQAGTPHRLWDRDVNQRVGRSQTWVLTEVGSMLDFLAIIPLYVDLRLMSRVQIKRGLDPALPLLGIGV